MEGPSKGEAVPGPGCPGPRRGAWAVHPAPPWRGAWAGLGTAGRTPARGQRAKGEKNAPAGGGRHTAWDCRRGGGGNPAMGVLTPVYRPKLRGRTSLPLAQGDGRAWARAPGQTLWAGPVAGGPPPISASAPLRRWLAPPDGLGGGVRSGTRPLPHHQRHVGHPGRHRWGATAGQSALPGGRAAEPPGTHAAFPPSPSFRLPLSSPPRATPARPAWPAPERGRGRQGGAGP